MPPPPSPTKNLLLLQWGAIDALSPTLRQRHGHGAVTLQRRQIISQRHLCRGEGCDPPSRRRTRTMFAEIRHPLLMPRTPPEDSGAISFGRLRRRPIDTSTAAATAGGGRRLFVLGCLASVTTAVAAAPPPPPSVIRLRRTGGFVGIDVGVAAARCGGSNCRHCGGRPSSAYSTSASSATDWTGKCRGGIGGIRGIAGTALASVPSSSSEHIATTTSANKATEGLAKALREAYSASSTDGVLAVVPDLLFPDDSGGDVGSDVPHPPPPRYTAEELLEASVEAAEGRSGDVASIVNALLAGCCPGDGGVDEEVDGVKAETASRLFRVLLNESKDSVPTMEPDLVTCACAFAACRRRDGDHGGHHPKGDVADLALQIARRRAKKLGGGRLRRSLARTRRRRHGAGGTASSDGDGSVLATDVAGDLRDRYGVEVLYEDDRVIGLSKPSGMVCRHKHNRSGKGAGAGGGGDSADDISLEDALDSLRLPLSTVNAADGGRGIVHRLDAGTSGCILVAKTDEAHLLLVAEFFRRNVLKSYLALVPGCGVDPPSGVINSDVDGRPARSTYRVEEMYGDGGPDDASSATLLRVETETGRRHQVRVHCAEGLGRPIFLDSTYGPSPALGDCDGDVGLPPSIAAAATDAGGGGHSSNDGGRRRRRGGGRKNDRRRTLPRCDRLFLHASTLHVPSFGVDIRAPLPGWWEEAVAGL